MKVTNLTHRKIYKLAQKIADSHFSDVKVPIGIMVSATHNRIRYPRDRFGHDSTLAVTIPSDSYKEHKALSSDLDETDNLLDYEWEYLILLGKDVLDKPETEQANIILHEMQHIKQNNIEPIVSAKDRLLDIIRDLHGDTRRTPSEINAKIVEDHQENSLASWVDETNKDFKQAEEKIQEIHKVIINPEGSRLIIPPEVAGIFEFYYKKVYIK